MCTRIRAARGLSAQLLGPHRCKGYLGTAREFPSRFQGFPPCQGFRQRLQRVEANLAPVLGLDRCPLVVPVRERSSWPSGRRGRRRGRSGPWRRGSWQASTGGRRPDEGVDLLVGVGGATARAGVLMVRLKRQLCLPRPPGVQDVYSGPQDLVGPVQADPVMRPGPQGDRLPTFGGWSRQPATTCPLSALPTSDR